MRKVREVLKSDGFLGLLEAALSLLQKYFFTFYYRLRIAKVGKGTVFEGPITLDGGRFIEIGSHSVIEKHVILRVVSGGSLRIKDHVFLASNSELITTNTLEIHSGVRVLEGASITSAGSIILGEKSWVGRGSQISGTQIHLEAEVILAPKVSIYDADHAVEQGKILMHSGVKEPVLLEKNCWIGTQSVILKGVRIGEGTIIGAGSVVTQTIPNHAVAFGNPARVKKVISVP